MAWHVRGELKATCSNSMLLQGPDGSRGAAYPPILPTSSLEAEYVATNPLPCTLPSEVKDASSMPLAVVNSRSWGEAEGSAADVLLLAAPRSPLNMRIEPWRWRMGGVGKV